MQDDWVAWSARVRARLRVAKLCGEGHDDGLRAPVATLPSLHGALPSDVPSGTVFTVCDEVYYHRYAEHLVRSVMQHSPGLHFHLHLCDPAEETLAAIEADRAAYDLPLTVSWECLDEASCPIAVNRQRYLILSRFIRAWQLVAASRAPVLMLDADCLVRGSLVPTFRDLGGADIGLFLRERNSLSWRRTLGAVAFFNATALGMRFLRDLGLILCHYVERGAPVATDQLVLYLLWRWYSRHHPSFSCARIARTLSDSEFEAASLVWHAKGRRKLALASDGFLGVPFIGAAKGATIGMTGAH